MSRLEHAAPSPLSELTLSRVWQDGLFSTTMRSTDGRRVSVVYRGVWTYSNGPDFRDAIIDIDGQLQRGAVELHVRASDWDAHGHSTNPAYDHVILHVVLDDDRTSPLLSRSGARILTVILSSFLTQPIESLEQQIFVAPLGEIGVRPCLPSVAMSHPHEVRAILRRAGWNRLVTKQLRFQQELELLPPSEVLYRGLLDGLGLMQNRAGMAFVADRVRLDHLETVSRSRDLLMAMLLEAGGFLPLTPVHATLAELTPADVSAIEGHLADVRASQSSRLSSPVEWSLNRVRPTNHPVRRLVSMADLVHKSGNVGILSTVLMLPLDRGSAWREWLETARPAIGRSRANQMAVNVLAPFLAAYADTSGDRDMTERVSAQWEQLPGTADDSIAKNTLRQIVGEGRFRIRSALESQGLHQIGRNGCSLLRCFECPVAALAARLEPLELGLQEEA